MDQLNYTRGTHGKEKRIQTCYCVWCRQSPGSLLRQPNFDPWPFSLGYVVVSLSVGQVLLRLRHLHSINGPLLVFHSCTVDGS